MGYTGTAPPYDPNIFTFDQHSPDIVIETDDANLVGTTITLELTATASSSGNSATDVFTVEFTDGCGIA